MFLVFYYAKFGMWTVISFGGDHHRQGQMDVHHGLSTWRSGKPFYQCYLHKSALVKNNNDEIQMWNFCSQLEIQGQVSWLPTNLALRSMDSSEINGVALDQWKIHPWVSPSLKLELISVCFFWQGLNPFYILGHYTGTIQYFSKHFLFFPVLLSKVVLKWNLSAITVVHVH